MSKVDAMRALKQARLEQLRSAAPARAAAPTRAAAPAPARAASPAPAVEVATGACGHRNMSGRSCTRSLGHSEKSHRYG